MNSPILLECMTTLTWITSKYTKQKLIRRNELCTIKVGDSNQLFQLPTDQVGRQSKYLEDMTITINKLGLNEHTQNLASNSENAYSSQECKKLTKIYCVKYQHISKCHRNLIINKAIKLKAMINTSYKTLC